MIAKRAHGNSRADVAHRDSLKKLSDKDLLKRLEGLRGRERVLQLEILRYLNEVERRRPGCSAGSRLFRDRNSALSPMSGSNPN